MKSEEDKQDIISIEEAMDNVRKNIREDTILIGSLEQLIDYFNSRSSTELLEYFTIRDIKYQLERIEKNSGYGCIVYVNMEKSSQGEIFLESKYVRIMNYERRENKNEK